MMLFISGLTDPLKMLSVEEKYFPQIFADEADYRRSFLKMLSVEKNIARRLSQTLADSRRFQDFF
jgi:hypothetical protein